MTEKQNRYLRIRSNFIIINRNIPSNYNFVIINVQCVSKLEAIPFVSSQMIIDVIAKYQMYILFFQETERYIF